jgi:hypothetical protein
MQHTHTHTNTLCDKMQALLMLQQVMEIVTPWYLSTLCVNGITFFPGLICLVAKGIL